MKGLLMRFLVPAAMIGLIFGASWWAKKMDFVPDSVAHWLWPLLIAVVWFATVHESGPVPRRLHLAAVDFADAEEAEAVSTDQVSAPDLPPAELEVNIPDALLLQELGGRLDTLARGAVDDARLALALAQKL